MPHQITQACVPCDACLPACPFDAITDGEDRYRIDAAKCQDCTACVFECPLDAIIPLPPPPPPPAGP